MPVSQMTQYRRDHPDYYEAEKVKSKDRMNALYQNNAEHRQKILEYYKVRNAMPEVKLARQAYRKVYNEKQKMKKLTQSLQNTQIAGES